VDVQVADHGATAILRGGFSFVPPSIHNEPPRILSLTTHGAAPNEPPQQARVGDTFEVSAVVFDEETAISHLVFEWSADHDGRFQGEGASVLFTPMQAGPVTVLLRVRETYFAPEPGTGLPISAENVATASVTIDVRP